MSRISSKRARFRELTYCHYDKMFRFAVGRLGNAEDAEDVLQESYAKAYKSFESLKDEVKAKSWFLQILINTIRDHVRKSRGNPPVVSLEDVADSEILAISSAKTDRQDPAVHLSDAEINPVLANALTELPDIFLTPLLLREIHGASYQEIAELLTIPVGTVMSRLARARTLLRKKLEGTILRASRNTQSRSTKGQAKDKNTGDRL